MPGFLAGFEDSLAHGATGARWKAMLLFRAEQSHQAGMLIPGLQGDKTKP